MICVSVGGQKGFRERSFFSQIIKRKSAENPHFNWGSDLQYVPYKVSCIDFESSRILKVLSLEIKGYTWLDWQQTRLSQIQKFMAGHWVLILIFNCHVIRKRQAFLSFLMYVLFLGFYLYYSHIGSERWNSWGREKEDETQQKSQSSFEQRPLGQRLKTLLIYVLLCEPLRHLPLDQQLYYLQSLHLRSTIV